MAFWESYSEGGIPLECLNEEVLLKRAFNAGTQCPHFRVQTYPFGPLPLASLPVLESSKWDKIVQEKPSLGVISILIPETGGKGQKETTEVCGHHLLL